MVARIGGAFIDFVQVHQSCRMVTSRTCGSRSCDLAMIQSKCAKFKLSDGGETIKLGSKGVQEKQLRFVRDEGAQNDWLSSWSEG